MSTLRLQKIIRSKMTLCWVAGSLAVPCSAAIIIDPFNTPQVLAVTASGANPKSGNNSTLANSPFALGGQREFMYRRLYGSSMGRLNVNSDNAGAATFSTGTNGVANGLIVYDGSGVGVTLGANGRVTPAAPTSPADAATKVNQFRYGNPDTFGLGAVDLTQGGLNDRIRVRGYADNEGVQLVLRFWVSATRYAEGVLDIPGMPDFGYHNYDILFTSFNPVGLGNAMAAFTGVNAITLQFNGKASTDASIDFFVSAADDPIPEPGTLALIAAGLLLLIAVKRRYRVPRAHSSAGRDLIGAGFMRSKAV